VWAFNLKQGAKYEDGTEFNATHVKYTFDRGIGMADEWCGAWVGLGYDGIIDNVMVTSTYVAKFCLKIPFAAFLSLMACQASYIVDPAYALKASVVVLTEGNAIGSHPIGLYTRLGANTCALGYANRIIVKSMKKKQVRRSCR